MGIRHGVEVRIVESRQVILIFMLTYITSYALQWLIVLPLEIVAASITLSFWEGARSINPAAFVGVFWLVIVIINLFGAKGYGEAEFVFAIVKILAVIGFIILGVIIACGGIAGQAYIGATYWHDPGSFNNGLKGVCSVFVIAAFSFAGTEIVGLTAAETDNPRLALPSAVKQVFWRIILVSAAFAEAACRSLIGDSSTWDPSSWYAAWSSTRTLPYSTAQGTATPIHRHL